MKNRLSFTSWGIIIASAIMIAGLIYSAFEPGNAFREASVLRKVISLLLVGGTVLYCIGARKDLFWKKIQNHIVLTLVHIAVVIFLLVIAITVLTIHGQPLRA
jgi:hypothetical protein